MNMTSMRLLAIDPGSEYSALLLYDTETRLPMWWEKMSNEDALRCVAECSAEEMFVEMIASYGMAVGASVFTTCVWVGRLVERWEVDADGRPPASFVYRREVKMHLCGSMRAKDANIRQALLDRYGGKEHAVGRKATPGPLYGLKSDCWSALGVAVTAAERETPVAASQLVLA